MYFQCFTNSIRYYILFKSLQQCSCYIKTPQLNQYIAKKLQLNTFAMQLHYKQPKPSALAIYQKRNNCYYSQIFDLRPTTHRILL